MLISRRRAVSPDGQAPREAAPVASLRTGHLRRGPERSRPALRRVPPLSSGPRENQGDRRRQGPQRRWPASRVHRTRPSGPRQPGRLAGVSPSGVRGGLPGPAGRGDSRFQETAVGGLSGRDQRPIRSNARGLGSNARHGGQRQVALHGLVQHRLRAGVQSRAPLSGPEAVPAHAQTSLPDTETFSVPSRRERHRDRARALRDHRVLLHAVAFSAPAVPGEVYDGVTAGPRDPDGGRRGLRRQDIPVRRGSGLVSGLQQASQEREVGPTSRGEAVHPDEPACRDARGSGRIRRFGQDTRVPGPGARGCGRILCRYGRGTTGTARDEDVARHHRHRPDGLDEHGPI